MLAEKNKKVYISFFQSDTPFVNILDLSLQVVVINKDGKVNVRHTCHISGVKLGGPRHVITDPHSGVLISDVYLNKVLLLRTTAYVVKLLDQHVRSPLILYLDTDHHRLYVSGTDQHKVHYVFVFYYALLKCEK